MVPSLVFGWSTDEWEAAATLVGPVVAAAIAAAIAVFLGFHQFRFLQEARDFRRYMVEDGALKLKAGLDALLNATRQNFATTAKLLAIVRQTPNDDPRRPDVEQLPALIPLDGIAWNAEAIGPASRLLDCMELGALTTYALSEFHSHNYLFHTQIAQVVRSYYSRPEEWSRRFHVEQQPWADNMMSEIDRRYKEAERYSPLSQWLEDAAVRLQELRLHRFTDISKIHRDETIQRLAGNVRKLLGEIQPEKDKQWEELGIDLPS
jgi:hypothetical protein